MRLRRDGRFGSLGMGTLNWVAIEGEDEEEKRLRERRRR